MAVFSIDDTSRSHVLLLFAEGHARMLELIRVSGVKGEKSMEGVWATFGRPYAPLGGAPKDVSPVQVAAMGAHVDCVGDTYPPSLGGTLARVLNIKYMYWD